MGMGTFNEPPFGRDVKKERGQLAPLSRRG
jgi:hypothetical protein